MIVKSRFLFISFNSLRFFLASSVSAPLSRAFFIASASRNAVLCRIDGFTEGVHVANQQIANSFRVLAGKEQKDYSQEIFKADNSMLRKPWAWQKRVYQNLELHLDAAIDKVENLSLDVRNQNYEEVKKTSDRDEKKVAAEKAKNQMDSYTTSVITPIMGVAEGEHKYGADAFEEFMAKQGDKDKDKAPVGVAPVKKDGKSR